MKKRENIRAISFSICIMIVSLLVYGCDSSSAECAPSEDYKFEPDNKYVVAKEEFVIRYRFLTDQDVVWSITDPIDQILTLHIRGHKIVTTDDGKNYNYRKIRINKDNPLVIELMAKLLKKSPGLYTISIGSNNSVDVKAGEILTLDMSIYPYTSCLNDSRDGYESAPIQIGVF